MYLTTQVKFFPKGPVHVFHVAFSVLVPIVTDTLYLKPKGIIKATFSPCAILSLVSTPYIQYICKPYKKNSDNEDSLTYLICECDAFETPSLQ